MPDDRQPSPPDPPPDATPLLDEEGEPVKPPGYIIRTLGPLPFHVRIVIVVIGIAFLVALPFLILLAAGGD